MIDMATKVVSISLPEYSIKSRPNYIKVGKKVDRVIFRNFQDGKYILRAISLDEHKKLSLEKMVSIILEKGTDKYDPKRKDVGHDELSGYDYDIQAGRFEIKNARLIIPKSYKYKTEFGDMVWHFYEHAPFDRGYSVRIDILTIYDPKKLVRAKKLGPKAQKVRKGLNIYLYKFKNPHNKRSALLGIVKILRK
jgi:hypothetical protein